MKRRKIMSMLLVICMVLCLLPVAAFADTEGAPAQEPGNEAAEITQPEAAFAEVTKEGETQTFSPGGEDNDALFEGYVNRVFGLSNGPVRLRKMSVGASRLTGLDLKIYNYLSGEIADIAAGVRASTEFELNTDFMEVTGLTGTGTTSDAAFADLRAKKPGAFDLNVVIDALLADHPYELFWFDKTAETQATGFHMTASGTAGIWTAVCEGTITISMPVAAEYAAAAYQVDTTKLASVQTAAERAQSIVSGYAMVSDYDKLQGYRTAICDAVSYNHDAASDSYTGPFGNPWQLIYVFDGDPDTKVVCEGYAKAFKYLCDLTEFSGNVSCITVSGTMSGGTGAGPHMWNLVKMEDGKNYLVDVTNCDEGTIGAPDQLFLAGTNVKSGYVTVNSGETSTNIDVYQFPCKGGNIDYYYELDTVNLYDPSDLVYADKNYTNKVRFASHQLILSGQIGVKFIVDPAGLTADQKNSAAMVFSVRGEDGPRAAATGTADSEGRLTYTCFVNALQMAEDITATFTYPNGTGDVSITDTFSVKAYIDYVKDHEDAYAKVAPLAKALGDYGHYAQIASAQINGYTISDKYTEMPSYNASSYEYDTIKAAVLEKKAAFTKGSSSVDVAQLRLSMDSETALSIRIHLEDESAFSGTATLGENTYSFEAQGGGYYVAKVSNIRAGDLGKNVTVSDGTAGGFSGSASALSYVYTALNSSEMDASVKNAVSALYSYHKAIEAYNNTP